MVRRKHACPQQHRSCLPSECRLLPLGLSPRVRLSLSCARGSTRARRTIANRLAAKAPRFPGPIARRNLYDIPLSRRPERQKYNPFRRTIQAIPHWRLDPAAAHSERRNRLFVCADRASRASGTTGRLFVALGSTRRGTAGRYSLGHSRLCAKRAWKKRIRPRLSVFHPTLSKVYTAKNALTDFYDVSVDISADRMCLMCGCCDSPWTALPRSPCAHFADRNP